MKNAAMTCIAALSMTAIAAPAHAVEELRIGLMQHNVRLIDDKNSDKEDGPNIEAEVVFGSPDFLSWAGSPRPYIMGSANTAGETSFAAAGLEWNWGFAEGWALQPGLGYAVHDGETNNPYPNGSPENIAFQNEHVLHGSSDVFRVSLSLDRDIGEKLGLQLTYEHLSHGQILGSGRNQGLDELGVRLRYKFGK